MKRIELKDLKPGLYWLLEKYNGKEVFEPAEVYDWAGSFRYQVVGNEQDFGVDEGSELYELPRPVVGQTELFSKTYCGESLADLERDISEAFLDNPAMDVVPVDEYNFHYGAFKVVMTWTPGEQ